MTPNTLKALSWPFRYLLVIYAKSITCLGFSHFLVSALSGEGHPLSFLFSLACMAAYAAYSYLDGDKRYLCIRNEDPPRNSIKNLLLPGLIAAFSYTIVSANHSLIAVNNISTWWGALHLFLVISLVKGMLLCLAMETLCAAESFVFEKKPQTYMIAGFFALGLLAMITNTANEWAQVIFVSTALFTITTLVLKTTESLSALKFKTSHDCH
ncbi:MAG: hypothetical protein RSD49_01465 [Hafnia sp.]